MNNDNTFQVVTTHAELVHLCQSLQHASWIALDTEFHREKTYYPELCLVQLATPEVTACIDPLAITDLSPFYELIYRPDLTLVMHAARQDLEIFFHHMGHLPTRVFDTQAAAPLVGLDEQMGYGALVKSLLDIDLDKSQARANWQRRPLPKAQLQYAVNDVVYLARLYPLLLEKLNNMQRLSWLDSDFSHLTQIATYENPPEHAWQKIRLATRLKPAQLSALQHLAAWREQHAQTENRPRNWVFRDDTLMSMAKLLPHNVEELSHINGLGEQIIKRHGTALIELIALASTQSPKPIPKLLKRGKLGHEESAIIDCMQAIANLCASRHNLHPSVIASRKDLENFYQNDPDANLASGWRYEIAGRTLVSFLEGDSVLGVVQGKLTLTQQ